MNRKWRFAITMAFSTNALALGPCPFTTSVTDYSCLINGKSSPMSVSQKVVDGTTILEINGREFNADGKSYPKTHSAPGVEIQSSSQVECFKDRILSSGYSILFKDQSRSEITSSAVWTLAADGRISISTKLTLQKNGQLENEIDLQYDCRPVTTN